jgi:hypothetical protein
MTSHDERAKDILDVLLDDLGTLEREFEVPALRPQRADLRFAPSLKHTATRRSLGILGLMTEVAQDDLRYFTDDEIEAVHRYLVARARRLKP